MRVEFVKSFLCLSKRRLVLLLNENRHLSGVVRSDQPPPVLSYFLFRHDSYCGLLFEVAVRSRFQFDLGLSRGGRGAIFP